MVEWSKDLYTNPNSIQSAIEQHQRLIDNNDGGEMAKIRSYNSETSLNSNSTGGQTNNNSLNGSINLTNNNSYDPLDFDMLKSKKELWERGIELFNKKPKKGNFFCWLNQFS